MNTASAANVFYWVAKGGCRGRSRKDLELRKTDRVADVVFVHGLDGDARATWHPKDQPGIFWPAWLGEDFPSLGVWSLGYQVAASAWKGHSMPLVDRATNALDLLELDEIGRRPVAFICHSLDGLLIKQVLRLASDSNKPAYKALAERTKLASSTLQVSSRVISVHALFKTPRGDPRFIEVLP